MLWNASSSAYAVGYPLLYNAIVYYFYLAYGLNLVPMEIIKELKNKDFLNQNYGGKCIITLSVISFSGFFYLTS